jgi:cytochrome c-type biogenesis protein CcmH/NrfG
MLIPLFLLLTVAPLHAASTQETVAAGQVALDKNDFEKAQDLFEKAVAAEPSNAQYHYLLGVAYGIHAQNANMFSAAILAKKTKAEFEKAVELDPDHMAARFALIDYYLEAPGFMGGSEEKAQEQVAQIRARDALAGHRAQGHVYLHQKKTDLARKEYVEAVREQPKSAKAHYYLGNFFMRDKNWSGARHELDMALELDPAYMPIQFSIGQLSALSQEGDPRGEDALRKYLAYHPADQEPALAAAWYFLGRIQEKQGKKSDAKHSYGNALKLAPGDDAIKTALKNVS